MKINKIIFLMISLFSLLVGIYSLEARRGGGIARSGRSSRGSRSFSGRGGYSRGRYNYGRHRNYGRWGRYGYGGAGLGLGMALGYGLSSFPYYVYNYDVEDPGYDSYYGYYGGVGVNTTENN